MSGGWRLSVNLPGFLEGLVTERAREEGATLAEWVGAVLAHAVGYEEGLATVRPWWQLDEVRIAGPLRLLEAALRVPIRADGSYGQRELASLLGVHQSTLVDWHQKGFLPMRLSEQGRTAIIRGIDVLLLLVTQAELALRGSSDGPG